MPSQIMPFCTQRYAVRHAATRKVADLRQSAMSKRRVDRFQFYFHAARKIHARKSETRLTERQIGIVANIRIKVARRMIVTRAIVTQFGVHFGVRFAEAYTDFCIAAAHRMAQNAQRPAVLASEIEDDIPAACFTYVALVEGDLRGFFAQKRLNVFYALRVIHDTHGQNIFGHVFHNCSFPVMRTTSLAKYVRGAKRSRTRFGCF